MSRKGLTEGKRLSKGLTEWRTAQTRHLDQNVQFKGPEAKHAVILLGISKILPLCFRGSQRKIILIKPLIKHLPALAQESVIM